MDVDYLITGGGGFIGSNAVARLVEQGRSVRVFDSFLTGNRANLAGVAGPVEVIEGDLRDAAAVARAVAGVRYVLHMAALPSVPRSVAEPQLAHDINVNGTLHLLLAARDAGCERVVFSSSSSVYGDTPALPKVEDVAPAPLSPYAVHKIAGEYYLKIFWELYQLPALSLRYFNVFGPRQDPQSQYAAVIPRFITSILNDQPPTVYGDGTQTRDFSFVDNIVDANLAACVAPRDACGRAYNIACGGRISLLDLVEAINQALGKQIQPQFELARPGDILHSQADISLAERSLGWRPQVDFADGIRRTISWYTDQLPR
ncbi:NAD-dependent epimerase/dehydratase family protein [bacterium]|nr:NAD-dependent epimerase/dehydratase family protein [bacterium]